MRCSNNNVTLLDYYREPVSQAKLSKVNTINSDGGGWWVHVQKIQIR